MNQPGAIFDWDGVVVDSSRLHVLSWEELAVLEERQQQRPVVSTVSAPATGAPVSSSAAPASAPPTLVVRVA